MHFDSLVVGQTIRRLRKTRRLSQDVLSGLAGIARTHLTMIENGSKQPNLALNLRPSELVSIIEKEIEDTSRLNMG